MTARDLYAAKRAAAGLRPTVVTKPGVYDLDEETYQADPVPARLGGSLSSSGAKLLVPPSTPAHFKHSRDHGRPPKAAFDLGHAVHKLVLGQGAEFVVVEADNWMTKAAKEARSAAREAGKTPLLRKEHDQAEAMAKAVREHPVARILFNPDHGRPEVSGFWQDDETEVWRRFRLDWLPEPRAGRLIVPDLKTTVDANPDRFGKHAADFGYFIQHPYYLDGCQALGLGDEWTAFVFVLVEKTPPHLVSVVELDPEAVDLGRSLIRRALQTYAECTGTDTWPGYSTEVESASLPYWFIRSLEGVTA
jgi:hypothetical protein